jgi:hypothetical protein
MDDKTDERSVGLTAQRKVVPKGELSAGLLVFDLVAPLDDQTAARKATPLESVLEPPLVQLLLVSLLAELLVSLLVEPLASLLGLRLDHCLVQLSDPSLADDLALRWADH